MTEPRRLSRRGLLAGITASTALGSASLSALAASSPATRTLLSQEPKNYTAITQTDRNDTIQVLVSLKHQTMQVFAGIEEIGSSEISSGKPGKETPHGIFSVISKHEFRWSNLYVREPMPFMQRLTWSGIALHAGELPGHPASHGCVRMPEKFAEQLYELDTSDRHVIVADEPTEPKIVSHPRLLLPRDAPKLSEKGSEFSAILPDFPKAPEAPSSPLRILLTRLTGREKMANAQKILSRLGYQVGKPDGLVGRKTWRAIFEFQKSIGMETPDGALSDETYAAIRSTKGADKYPDGHLYVRLRQKPLFDLAVDLKDPDTPLGDHLLSLTPCQDGKSVKWLSVSLNENTAQAGLDAFLRFTIPADIRQRLMSMLSLHSSIAISDAGLGRETGKGTDFVVVTHNPADH
ncbi:MAG: L,D-transpeptidase family protein [Anderseniella sp.]